LNQERFENFGISNRGVLVIELDKFHMGFFGHIEKRTTVEIENNVE
jgi:hypothetical protein